MQHVGEEVTTLQSSLTVPQRSEAVSLSVSSSSESFSTHPISIHLHPAAPATLPISHPTISPHPTKSAPSHTITPTFRHNLLPTICTGTFAQGCENGCGAASADIARQVGGSVLTISKLKRWSINYYIDTAADRRARHRGSAAAGGGLGEYYSEHETRTPVWLCAGDARTVADLVGLTDAQRAGGEADPEVVARWLDDGVAPNGARGRAFGDARCARVRSDVLRTQERVAGPGAAHRRGGGQGDRRRAHHRDGRGDGVPGRACRLHPGAQPGHRGEGSGAAAGVGGDRLSARNLAVRGSAPAHPRHRAQPPSPRRRRSWCRSTGRRCITKPAPPG